ncbi:contractile injection system protein, VgrG/Pvc8 family [Chitiniphilus purpureus]|uniref:Contractile injection system protein, VgrG/Pvc8 family n=1 Tax=Chitiniphilus purpureus TaxID=2981137 RepID=A0ABY6DS99_9NEIS|nr:contractile injection system protein, VgrG/Pvc8 family [Chitiniphilus sp. CD1]UXY17244.1 contractile injection system protein, VgrG/Pvc8 family [Chitiniphilus sp. CD1]
MNDPIRARTLEIGRSTVIPTDAQALYLHCAFFLPGSRILSDETFRLVSLGGQESASEPFEYQLTLHANTGSDSDHVAGRPQRVRQPLRFSELIGRPATAAVHYPVPQGQLVVAERFAQAVRGNGDTDGLALFNGIVTTFAMEEPGVYRATLRPALYKLTLTNRYQVYSHLSICGVIEALMKRHRVAYSVAGISGEHNLATARVQDWLQAGETDYELLRRLMNKAHIGYYIAHGATGHTVVFLNRADYPTACPDGRPLRYTATLLDEVGLHQPDLVTQYSYQVSLQPSAVSGTATRQEAAWERDAVAEPTSYHARTLDDAGELPFRQYKIYQYGCSQDELQEFAGRTQLALSGAGSQLSGASTCPFLRVGHRFEVSGDPWDGNPDPVRPTLADQPFVLTMVKHEASLDGGYQNQFQAIDAAGLLAPFSIADTQQGAVLAVVVPPPPPPDWRYYDKHVYTPDTATMLDHEGDQRQLKAIGVYVRFTTDEADDTAARVWVKLAPHMQTVPEYGVTVTVARAQDESELPEVQSIVQSNGTQVIMPSGWTASSHVGNSYGTSYGDGKRITFGASSRYDLGNAVNLVTAAYARGVFRDANYAQGGSYGYSTSEQAADGMLSESWSFGCGYGNSWAKESKNFSATGRSFNHTVRGKYDTGLQLDEASYPDAAGAVDANVVETFGNTWVKSTQIGNSTANNTMIGNSDATSITIGDSLSAAVQVGNTVNAHIMTGIASNTSLHNIDRNASVTAMTDSLSAVGVSISAGMVGMTRNTSLTGMAESINITGSNQSMSMTGSQQSISANGSVTSMEATGMVTSMSMTGMRTGTSMTGMVNDTSMTGVTTSTSMVGSTTSVSMVGMSTSMSMVADSSSVSLAGNSVSANIVNNQISADCFLAGAVGGVDQRAKCTLEQIIVEVMSSVRLIM